MSITPEMARSELMRRRSSMGNTSSSAISPQMARAELERRSAIIKPKDIEEPQEEGFVDYAKRGLARGSRNAVVGALDTLDFLATPIREGLNLGAKALGSERRFKPLGEEVAKGIDTLTGGYTAPRNPSEKTGEAIGRALASLPTGLGLGTAAQGIKYAPKAIEAAGKFLKGANVMTPTNVAASGATSGLIQSSLNENPQNISGALGAGIAGGVGIPAAAGLLSTLRGKGRQAAAARTGELFKINPEAVETFQKAAVTPTLADVSHGKIPKMLTSKLEHIPFAAEPIREAKELQRKQILEGLGQEEGRLLSKAETGRLAIKGTKKYQKGREKEFGEGFKKVEEDISKLADNEIGFENTNKYFDSILKNIKTPSQEKRFKNSPLGKIYTDLYESAKENKGKLPYYDVKERMDEINDLITTQGLIGKSSQGKLKQAAVHLSQDIEQSLEPKFKALGEDSYKNWKEVKKSYASYAQEEIPKLNELYKKDKKGAVDAFMDIMQNQKKGGEKAKIALQGLSHPEQLDFMDSINKQLGSKSDGTFSPLVWVRKFKGLEPESKKILLSPLNESNQKKVKYIADTMDHLKSTLEEANTSKTAYYTALGALGAIGAKSMVSLASGNPLPAAQLATGLFMGNRISDQLLTNPKFINWMYKGMKAKDFNHFERNLDRIPKVGKLTRTLMRSVQTFQNDLEKAEEKTKEKKK
jgi:hypothetical protein